MIVLYSSFFFDRDTRKLCYPVKHQDGSVSTMAVSMLDDFTPSTNTPDNNLEPVVARMKAVKNRPIDMTGFKEDFDLYKVRNLN